MAERRLIGFRHSIYTWIARLVMAELRLDWVDEEADPFGDPPPARLLALNPAGRVPVLVEGGLVLSETRVIARYLAEGSALVPEDAVARARMDQVIAVLDADAYWPMVRQVYGQAVFGPASGAVCDPAVLRAGLDRSARVLARLEALCDGPGGMVGGRQTLADCHAAPMLHALGRHDAGAALIAGHCALSAWLAAQRARPAFAQTRPPPPA